MFFLSPVVNTDETMISTKLQSTVKLTVNIMTIE